MNKSLKFIPSLVPLILNGEKTTTWRLFDDKALQNNDVVDFLNSETKEKVATAQLIEVVEKPFSELTPADWVGHEKFPNNEAMYKNYTELYKQPVTPSTKLKIIKFKLI